MFLLNISDQDWDQNEDFWEKMGGLADIADLKSAEEGGTDENYWRTNRQQVTLWRLDNFFVQRMYKIGYRPDSQHNKILTYEDQNNVNYNSAWRWRHFLITAYYINALQK